MNTLFNINWPAIVALLGGLFAAAFLLLSIIYIQVWRHRIHRFRRAVRGSRPAARAARVVRDVQPEVQSEDRIQEYLENADFSNEGNPNFGWKERFLERSFN